MMIACISPADRFFEESISTLNYATRAANISNIPVKNVDPKIRIINELKHKVRMLQIELKNANEHISYLTNMTGENLKTFGLQLMKVEDDIIDLGDGRKIKLDPFVSLEKQEALASQYLSNFTLSPESSKYNSQARPEAGKAK
mmetsp:Transcript_19424/g.18530  ORF Transcript_19424/g.18530 Transcript_19424/m.18530 type:complete len:143 (+) Transcript_19424:898-1326(+)